MGNIKPTDIFLLPHERLFPILFAAYQSEAMVDQEAVNTLLIDRIVKNPLVIEGDSRDLQNWRLKVANICSDNNTNLEYVLATFDQDTSQPLLKLLNGQLKAKSSKRIHDELYNRVQDQKTFKSWLETLEISYTRICTEIAKSNQWLQPSIRFKDENTKTKAPDKSNKNKPLHVRDTPVHQGTKDKSNKGKPAVHQEDKSPGIDRSGHTLCASCGKTHDPASCWFVATDHPDINKDPTKSFLSSTVGKAYARLGRQNLRHRSKLSPEKDQFVFDGEMPAITKPGVSVHDTPPSKTDDEIMANQTLLYNIRATTPMPSLPAKVPMAKGDLQTKEEDLTVMALKRRTNAGATLESEIVDVSHAMRLEAEEHKSSKTYLDTGAMEYNYISYKLVYDKNLECIVLPNTIKVKSINGRTDIKKFVLIPSLTLTYKQTKKKVLTNVIFLVLQHSPIDMIIGLPTIRRFDLTRVFRPYFVLQHRRKLRADESAKEFRARLICKYQEIKKKAAHAGAQSPATTEVERQAPSAAGLTLFTAEVSSSTGVVTQTTEKPYTASMPNSTSAFTVRTVIDKTDVIDGDADDDEVDLLVRPTGWDDYFARTQQNEQPYTGASVSINNDLSEAEKTRILTALNKYSDRFNMKVDSPATIPPFEINLDRNKWTKMNSRRYVRPLSEAKKAAVEAFIKQALADGLIKLSNAGAFSQVLLTPKPNGKWRFCIDYRALNELSESLGWPIPNIKQMLNNIGSKKPKYFAVLDLTSGYYQAPLAATSQPLTAFITHMGLYEWTRVPMGAKGAPPYFQYHMVNSVFAGLVHNICEIYLDDIIVWGDSIEDLASRMETLLARAKEYNITFNPEKCRVGMTEVEYVGHVIDSSGLSFTKAKRDKVEDFRLPSTGKDMKSFLGLASYFREHVKGFTELAQPLREMMETLKPKQPLKWTTTQEQAFRALQNAIVTCPKNMFLEAGHPVFVQTDASDYGIGAYLFQRVDGQERPIGFISKSLNKVERRWSTIEKEAFAIFYALQKWEEYLRDIKFTLQTDHKNLTYVNAEPKAKVQRWKLAIQSFDFWLEHIPGKDNIVADGMSRFCEKESTIETNHLLTFEALDKVAHVDDKFQNQSKRYSAKLTAKLNEAVAKRKPLTAEQLRNRTMPPAGPGPNQVIPADKYKLISSCHSTYVGHWGVQRTMDKVRKKQLNDPKCPVKFDDYDEPQLRKDVDQFIKACPCCQKMSQLKPYIHTYKYVTSKWGVMENLAMDTIVGLPKTNRGNEHLLVIVDTFSRYMQLMPLKDLTAQGAIEALTKYVNTFGKPFSILTDNASQFQEIYKEALQHLGIDDRKIHPYSHEENAIVERTNKEVERHLRNIMFHEKVHERWDEFCPIVERIKNNEICNSTGVTPVELVFGRSINLDRGHLYPIYQVPTDSRRMADYIRDQRELQTIALQIAYETQAETDKKHLSKQKIQKKTEYAIGDYVLIAYEKDGHKPPSKLHPILRGPCRIVNKVSRSEGDIYTVQHLDSTKLEDFHVKLIRKFHHDARFVDPISIATSDNQTFEVERILNHRFTTKKQIKSSMEVLVQWVGYKETTWEPYANVATVAIFHEYLRKHGLARLLRDGFKDSEPARPNKRQRV